MHRIAFGTGKAWLNISQYLKLGSPSLRESLGLRKKRPTVIILDGKTFEGNESAIAKNIAALSAAGQNPVITFDSLPQISKFFTHNPNESLPECVNEAGREMANRIRDEILHEEKSLSVTTIGTRILINGLAEDPSIYIGPALTLKEISQGDMGKLRKVNGTDLAKLERPNNQDWYLREFQVNPQTSGRFKRVVHASTPGQFQTEDIKKINKHLERGSVIISAANLPIKRFPSSSDNFVEVRVNALIDNFLASALLAISLKARQFILSTSLDYSSPWLKENTGYLLAQQALRLNKKQELADNMATAGVINALRRGVNTCLITTPELDWEKDQGILLTRGADLSGRMYNFARMVGLLPNELQQF
jgi:carbamate kinase